MKKLLSALGIASLAAVFLFGTPAALAAAPTAALSTPGAGIDSIAGNGTVSGSEAGAHTIVVTDATASTLTGADAESNTNPDTIAIGLAGTEVITLTIGGTAITTAALAAAVADTATLADVATDMTTKINAATVAPNVNVLVTVAGASPAKHFVITVTTAGALNSISSTMTGDAFTALGFFGMSPVAGTNATAVDTFAAATGSNGLWVAGAGGTTKTIAHAPAAPTASTLAGLKTSLIGAGAMIEGVTIGASGVLSAGTAVITQTPGVADAAGNLYITGTATVIAGVANEITITAKDDAANRALAYTGAKSLTFGGAAVLGACTPAVEGTNVGSATSVTFTNGVTSGTNATLTTCKSEDVTLTATDGAATSAGHTLAITVNPATISTLTCLSGGQAGAINLNWAAPAGVSNGYEVKYYSDPINASNYASGSTYVQAWASGTVAAAQAQVATGFNSGTRYHFAIKALGLNSNESAVSNTISCVAPPVGGSSAYADSQAPTSRITSPAANGTAPSGVALVIKGTAKDNGTSSVQKVEVSVDGGLTWALATVTSSDISNLIWEFTWTNPSAGEKTIMVRSTDWVNNVEIPISQKITITSGTVVTTPSGVAAPGLQTAPGIQDRAAQIKSLQQQLITLLQQLLNQLIAQLAAAK
ncbi:MAG: Ig-like domain-containing protein [Candidatus Colwellbacteria bacterium]|nr:Ig-like domain-containing protein [Candidatus Colwellbacteria bacterium]